MKTDIPANEPIVALSDWSVYEVPLRGDGSNWTRHFVGFAEDLGLPQVSSAIEAFDAATGIGTAQSGRVFQLAGESGSNPASAFMWKRWKLLNCITAERDVNASMHRVMQPWAGAEHV